ncbi:hypothetical protein B9T33_11185 [Acinetobacter sp. ANC 5054]|uniref:AAA family ATPase n=1 Tax=Acinetobacter sp. ANC 5054 TaxID=1977877 RepID=UPI000A33D12A|nr:AAA family ATPase [Acinetobacter sp. ANC 5054]OTG79696.1 hypothetical protein B9T33_11185 [Acinetobacter sp. ANC 5054]
MILTIEIEKLFGRFDYLLDLKFDQRENLVLITAPNGFGKSTILRIINNFFNKKFNELYEENFHLIKIKNESKEITINKENDKDSRVLRIFDGEEEFLFDFKEFKKRRVMGRHFHIDLFDEIKIEKTADISIDVNMKWLNDFIGSYKVDFISTNRLYTENKDEKNLVIKELSNNIAKTINNFVNEQYTLSKNQENSFHKRILSGLRLDKDKDISIGSVNSKVKELVLYNNKYNKIFGSVNLDLDENLFNEFTKDDLQKNGPFLMVLDEYLNDVVKRSRKFQKLGEKLQLFTDAVNELLLFKQIEVDRKKGIIFSDNSVGLEGLSSGEQHLLILIGKLIFETQENTLVLIDEPEISLHPAWQEKIIEIFNEIKVINKLKIIIATHSPSLIGEKWESVIELAELVGDIE